MILQRRTFLAATAAAATLPGISQAQMQRAYPIFAKWTGPYGGVPAFDRARVADFQPSIEGAIAEHQDEIAAIAGQTAAPNFANTLAGARS